MLEFLAGIGAGFVSLFGFGQPAESIAYQASQPAAVVAQTASADPALSAPAGTSAVINQFITHPVMERQVLAENAITRAELDTALASLRSDLLAAMQRNLPSVYTIATPAPSAPVSITTFAHSQKIDNLANVTITNATVSGVTGLTDADIPDTITASNYLPLSGGTLVTASSSQFSVFDRAYFGGVATSTFDSLGSLALVGSLSVSTTTATSTFAGGLQVSGLVDLATTTITGGLTVAGNTNITQGGQLTVGDKIIAPGEIGVGTSTPWGKLSVVNTGTIPSFIVGDEADDTSPFIIDATGNVGIGTVSPGARVEIKSSGTDYATKAYILKNSADTVLQTVTSDGRTFVGADTGTNYVLNVTRSTGSSISGIAGLYNADGLDLALSSDTTYFSTAIIGSSGKLSWGNTGVQTNQVVLDTATGNLGVGTTNPLYKLDIATTTNTVGVRAASNNAGDILYYGTGTVIGNLSAVLGSISATGNLDITAFNTNTTAGNAVLSAKVGGASAGDPYLDLTINGVQNWTIGVDNSDSDKLKIGPNSSPSNGTASLTIDTSGNVGIGTTTPTLGRLVIPQSTEEANLVLYGSPVGHRPYMLYQLTGAQWRTGLKTSDGNAYLIRDEDAGANVFTIEDGSPANMLYLDNTGNVGIGTTNPGRELHLSAAIPRFRMEDTDGGYGEISANSGHFTLSADPGNAIAGSRIAMEIDGTEYMRLHSAGGLSLGSGYVSTNPGAGSMIVSGNVGIGTTTPGQKLVIDSGSSGNSIASTFTGGTGRPYWLYDFQQQGAKWSSGFDPLGSTNGFAIRDVDASRTPFFISDGGASVILNAYNSDSTNANVIFQTNNGTERVRITGAGNVGIATTSPWRTLSVTGTVGFDGVTGATGAGSLCLSSNREVVYNSASDACLASLRDTKHDINPLVVDALSQVLALQPVSFVYNEGDARVRYGFIAEDTAAVDARLTTYSASGTLSGIDDRSILAVVVKAIQDLASKIAALFASDSVQNAQIAALEARIAALEAEQGSGGGGSNSPTPPEEGEPDTEPPVITVSGNNPAILQIGDTYNDLGAAVTDNVDTNLGYQIFVGTTPLAQAFIDTSEPNEWHIYYVATDNAGNTATSTRTVIVEPPSIVPAEPAEEPEPELATS